MRIKGADLALMSSLHANAKIVNGAKKKTNPQLGLAIFAIFRKNRDSSRGLVFSNFSVLCDVCDFNDFCENCEFGEKSQKLQNTEKKAKTRPRQESRFVCGSQPRTSRSPD